MPRPQFVFERALTPNGWADRVAITIGGDGCIASIETGAHSADTIKGFALPGVCNLHSHTFQRGMAGLAERASGAGQFWSWRDVMYRFSGLLTPDDVEAIAAQACLEMAEAGFTSAIEFHYLHHAPDGRAYADPAELSHRIVAAASSVGLRLTLLPVFYAHAGADGRAPEPGQRRFIHTLDQFARLIEAVRKSSAGNSHINIGLAPHSLRAATLDEIKHLIPLAGSGPIHIHAAEQTREVDELQAVLGGRPVEILLDRIGLDARWCLIHCTHMTPDETRRLAASGAVAGLCPITEANLGDGIFDGVAYTSAGGAYGVGSDSNIRISLADELRTLDYSQRLRDRARNVLTRGEHSTARTLLDQARAGGARASGTAVPSLAIGAPADIIVLDRHHPALIGRHDDDALNAWVFSADNAAIQDVFSGGNHLVKDGHHRARTAITGKFQTAMQRIMAAW
jgi:formimidoylglutamate deiminase